MGQWRWGRAGQRLTDSERAARARSRAHTAQVSTVRRQHARERWRRGLVRPDAITAALDLGRLYGPQVDEACGVEEPAVDMWETGELYPSWDQLLALSALTGFPVDFFTKDTAADAGPIYMCGPRGYSTVSMAEPITRYRREVVADRAETMWNEQERIR